MFIFLAVSLLKAKKSNFPVKLAVHPEVEGGDLCQAGGDHCQGDGGELATAHFPNATASTQLSKGPHTVKTLFLLAAFWLKEKKLNLSQEDDQFLKVCTVVM